MNSGWPGIGCGGELVFAANFPEEPGPFPIHRRGAEARRLPKQRNDWLFMIFRGVSAVKLPLWRLAGVL
jgi:hypothetical protein